MRNLRKLECPAVLREKAHKWLQKYNADMSSEANKRRYRNPEIKGRLKEETGNKCIYCESKIGHNTPGDVEHISPISKCHQALFEWTNLTLSCTECNRRKGAYYKDDCRFIDPYIDDVESLIVHFGPIVSWKTGCKRAEVSISILELNSSTRSELVVRKIEKIHEVADLMERWHSESSPVLKELLERRLYGMSDQEAEFSGMVAAVIAAKKASVANSPCRESDSEGQPLADLATAQSGRE